MRGKMILAGWSAALQRGKNLGERKLIPMQTHLGWYSRGYISHYDRGNIYQVVTYRLADSLPTVKLNQLNRQLQDMDVKKRQVARRKQIEKWLDVGLGSCLLKHKACAQTVIEAWKHFNGVRYDLVAWVVMPNHVHLLAYFHEGWPMGKVINSWKSYTARRINHIATRDRLKNNLTGRKTEEGVWQRGYWDRYIRSEAHFNMTIEYIHQNPVAAGLVEQARDWPFSSIRTHRNGRSPKWLSPQKQAQKPTSTAAYQ